MNNSALYFSLPTKQPDPMILLHIFRKQNKSLTSALMSHDVDNLHSETIQNRFDDVFSSPHEFKANQITG